MLFYFIKFYFQLAASDNSVGSGNLSQKYFKDLRVVDTVRYVRLPILRKSS